MLVRKALRIYLCPHELAHLAPHYPDGNFSRWARERIFESVGLPPPALADAPAHDPREVLMLPVQGDADDSGTRYHWEPRPKGDAGTLTLLEGSGRALQVDLGGVTITTRADGTRELRFTERSQVRAADELPEGIYG